jgi:membrane-associated protease RseP (regulator of RpoE activity)
VRRPLLVAEQITARYRLFQVSGVSWSATRYAWLSPGSWVGLGLATAVASRAYSGLFGVALAGIGYGAVLFAANVIHSLGHVVAGRIAGAGVETVLLTSTRDVIIYGQPGAAAPPRRRLIRALGGPVASLAAGCILMLVGHLAAAPGLRMAGIVNVAVSFWTLMPIPSLDGWVIWRDLAHRKRRGSR